MMPIIPSIYEYAAAFAHAHFRHDPSSPHSLSKKYGKNISLYSPLILLYLSPSASNRMAEPISLRRLQFDAIHIHLCPAPVGRREHRRVGGIQLEDIATTHLEQVPRRRAWTGMLRMPLHVNHAHGRQ